MNEDYLWDRSGEPDEDVQELEEILGTLRYQPRPLEIPEQPFRRSGPFLMRTLAIAAAVALLALGLGIWLAMQNQSRSEVATSAEPQSPQSAEVRPDDTTRAAANPLDEQKVKNLLAANTPRRSPAVKQRQRVRHNSFNMSAAEIAKAKATKDELILALRLASSKLSFAQKKTQAESVHNQHKVG